METAATSKEGSRRAHCGCGWVGREGRGGGVVVWWCGVVSVVCVVQRFRLFLWMIDLCGKHSQAESVAGAAHLPNDYAGVLR